MRQVILAIALFTVLTIIAAYLGARLPGIEIYDHLMTGSFNMSVGSGCG